MGKTHDACRSGDHRTDSLHLRGLLAGFPSTRGALAVASVWLPRRRPRPENELAMTLGWHDRTPTPFERACTALCFGERLRRSRQRIEARDHLRAALEAFSRLGARPWADRSRAELRATGETAHRRDAATGNQLTTHELQVALLVAEGATNREAAAALFVNPKTIDSHLRSVYRKLNIRSRPSSPTCSRGRRRRGPGQGAGGGHRVLTPNLRSLPMPRSAPRDHMRLWQIADLSRLPLRHATGAGALNRPRSRDRIATRVTPRPSRSQTARGEAQIGGSRSAPRGSPWLFNTRVQMSKPSNCKESVMSWVSSFSAVIGARPLQRHGLRPLVRCTRVWMRLRGWVA
jgi:DNA-binding CsgD family transcriptional regulator